MVRHDYEQLWMSQDEHFTLKETILQLRESVDKLSQRVSDLGDVDDGVERNRNRIDDLETRMRALEKWRYALPISVIPSVIAMVLVALSFLWGSG